MTAYGYVRVSTKDQVEGFGLDVQKRAIGESGRWLPRGEVTVFADEGVSGTLMDRPGLGDAIDRLTAGDVLVVPRLDRLARDLITQELLLRAIRAKGADVVSCVEGENAYLAEDAGDPSRKLIRQILGAVAEYERSVITLRMQAGIRAKKAAGGYAGGQPPYGWRGVDGSLVEVPEEQRILGYMRHFQFARDFSWIAQYLNSQLGVTTRKGKPWTRQSVRKVLLRQGTPAGAVGKDRIPVNAGEVDDEVAVLNRDGRKNSRTDRGYPLSL